MDERVTISDALAYIKEKSGYDFDRKTFTRWLEQGSVSVDHQTVEVIAKLVEGRWWVSRRSIERLIEALTSISTFLVLISAYHFRISFFG